MRKSGIKFDSEKFRDIKTIIIIWKREVIICRVDLKWKVVISRSS